jgi:4-amino-4-deoxy-L-arabinose transferase-like glycosyltransferase
MYRACMAVALIAAVTLPQFLLGLGDRNIWIPLEARYALVAREMLEAGHWILPHLGGEVYADKPPLLFWAIAFISSLGSEVTEWTARLPTALAAVSVCLVTWRTGVRLFSPRAGLMAALVLATSGGFFWSGRQALPDMLLTLWTTGASWALWEWFSRQHHKAALVAGICMGLATLTKGPVGLILPALSGLMYLAVRRQLSKLWGRSALICLGAFLAVTLSWFVPAVAQGGLEYAQMTLLHHSLERYVRAWEHTAPWYFYLGAFPAELLPWTLFLPQALFAGAWLPRHLRREGWWFTLCWLVTILGWIWSHWWDRNAVSMWAIRLPALGLALTLCGLAVGIWGSVEGFFPSRRSLLLPTTHEAGMWASLLLFLGGMILGSVVLTQRTRLTYAVIVGCTWLAMLVTTVWVYTPQFNQRYPSKSFAAAVHTHMPSGRPLQLCGPMNDLALRFNLGHFVPAIQQTPDIMRYLERGEQVYCVIDGEVYQRLGELMGQWFPIGARQEFNGSRLLLISNQNQ